MGKIISVKHLHLYIDNPRLPHSGSEEEALFLLVEDQKRKLLSLAKDIASNGLSPLENIAVFPHFKRGHYFVAEGNRRVAVLKLLNDPDLIAERFPSLSKSFKAIEIGSGIDITSVSAQVYKSEDDPELVHIIEQRHLGEQNGVGVVAWNPIQKARFYALHHGDNALLTFLSALVERGFLSQDQVDSVTKTNWERILRPIGLEFLKLKKEKSSYIIPEDHLPEFTAKIRLIANELCGKTVAIVYATEQIETFFNSINELYNASSSGPLGYVPDAHPNKAGATPISKGETVPNKGIDKPAAPDDPAGPGFQVDKKPDTPYEPSIPRNPYINSKTVIPKGIRLQSRNARVGKIISELQRLPVEEYPNACGALLRLLIELSAKTYLEDHGTTDLTKTEFTPAIKQTLQKLRDEKKIEPGYSSQISHAQEEVRKLFDGHMHNTDAYPSSIVIKETFCTFEKFIRLCLE